MTTPERPAERPDAVECLAALLDLMDNKFPKDAENIQRARWLAFKLNITIRGPGASAPPEDAPEPAETCPTCGAPVEVRLMRCVVGVVNGERREFLQEHPDGASLRRYIPPRSGVPDALIEAARAVIVNALEGFTTREDTVAVSRIAYNKLNDALRALAAQASAPRRE